MRSGGKIEGLHYSLLHTEYAIRSIVGSWGILPMLPEIDGKEVRPENSVGTPRAHLALNRSPRFMSKKNKSMFEQL